MDYEVAKDKAGQAMTSAAIEGGAVVAGLFASGFVGKQTENFFKKGVVKTSPLMDKLIAWGANNGPKAAMWWITKKYIEPEGGDASRDFGKAFYVDARKGAMASIALDTIMRLSNDMAPVKFPQLFGIDMMGNTGTPTQNNGNTKVLQSNLQRMVQENSSLRSQLNSAMTRLASTPTVNVQELRAPESHDTRFGMMDSTIESQNRRKNFGAMTPPIQDERNRRFGAMDKKSLNFAGENDSTGALYGML